MIDFHCHILPMIDDGSRSIDETIEMLKEAKEAGFDKIITTSHFIEGFYNVTSSSRDEIINAIKSKIKSIGIDIELYNGAEAYAEPDLANLFKKGIIPTLANSKYILFEFPMNEKIIYDEDLIKSLKESGYIPVIAHPERYGYVQENIKIASKWYENGALFQCNYGSIIGQYGEKAKKILKKLLEKNMVDFLGSDCHRCNSTYLLIDDAIKELKNIISDDYIEKLTQINPNKVIENNFLNI